MPSKPTKHMVLVEKQVRRGVFTPIDAPSNPDIVSLVVMFEYSVQAHMPQRRGMVASYYHEPKRSVQRVDIRNVASDGRELTSDMLDIPMRDIDRVIALLTAIRQYDRDLGLGPLGKIAVLNEINEKLLATTHPLETANTNKTIP